MLKSNLASLQSAALSQPVTVGRQMSTSDTEVTPTQPMMPAAYQYPMAYTQMGFYGAQPVGCHAVSPTQTMMPAPTVINTPVTPVQHTGVASMAPAATSLPMNLSVPIAGETQQPYTSESLYHAYQAGVPIYPAPAQPSTYPKDTVIYAKPVDQFNVEETSNWVRLLGETSGWSEATKYAAAFFQHGITGLALSQLTVDHLEKNMNIQKLGHRLTLINAIKSLYTPYGGSCPMFERRFSSISTSAAPSTTAETIDMSSDAESEQDNCTEIPEILPALKLHAHSNSARRRSIIIEPLQPQLSRENLVTHDQHLESITLKPPQLLDTPSSSSMMSAATSDCSVGSCVSASSQATSSSCASSSASDRKSHLTLTLSETPSCNREAMWDIKTKFATFGFVVHPRPSDKDSKKFFLQFINETEAQRAMLCQDQLNMDLSEYTEIRKKKGPRPTPSNPQRYMVLHHARMRSGKSMRSTVVGFLKKGEIHWVNQIKGKRARIIERDDDGDRNIGWVSLRNNAGFKFLQKLPVAGCLP